LQIIGEAFWQNSKGGERIGHCEKESTSEEESRSEKTRSEEKASR